MYDNEWIYTEKYGFLNPNYYDYSKLKHSKNIIDLIEVGDYVNGMLVVSVTEITLDDKGIKERVVFVNRDENCTLKPLQICNGNIKSIVTKEQFASIEYVF